MLALFFSERALFTGMIAFVILVGFVMFLPFAVVTFPRRPPWLALLMFNACLVGVFLAVILLIILLGNLMMWFGLGL